MARSLDEPAPRGDFFKSLGTVLAGFVAAKLEDAITGAGPKLLRPPGALDAFAFLTACTRCDRCLEACTRSSLLKATAGAGLAMGTPYILPRNMPCFLCPDLPCVKACPEGALVWPRRRIAGEEREGARATKMGSAHVDETLCLAWGGEGGEPQPCRTCLDRCPFPGEALRLDTSEPPHPQVDAEACTGCGLCTFGCPTLKPAITVLPE